MPEDETKAPAVAAADDPGRRPAARKQEEPDELDVIYQGPSDEFVHDRGRMVKGGEPIRMSRTELANLRGRFPDHSWAEV